MINTGDHVVCINQNLSVLEFKYHVLYVESIDSVGDPMIKNKFDVVNSYPKEFFEKERESAGFLQDDLAVLLNFSLT